MNSLNVPHLRILSLETPISEFYMKTFLLDFGLINFFQAVLGPFFKFLKYPITFTGNF